MYFREYLSELTEDQFEAVKGAMALIDNAKADWWRRLQQPATMGTVGASNYGKWCHHDCSGTTAPQAKRRRIQLMDTPSMPPVCPLHASLRALQTSEFCPPPRNDNKCDCSEEY